MPTADSSSSAAPRRLTPDEIIERLREVRDSIPHWNPLSAAQRRVIRDTTRDSEEVLLAEFDLIDQAEGIRHAVRRTSAEAREMYRDAVRWNSVEHEIESLLIGISGGNLLLRQQLQILGSQAYIIATTLARGAAGRDLITRVELLRRLRNAGRKKRAAKAPQEE